MHKSLLSLAAATAIASTAALLPTRANAMGVGTAAAIEMAAADLDMMESVAYVCRHRGYSRRACWWVPGRRYYRPYRHRYYRRW